MQIIQCLLFPVAIWGLPCLLPQLWPSMNGKTSLIRWNPKKPHQYVICYARLCFLLGFDWLPLESGAVDSNQWRIYHTPSLNDFSLPSAIIILWWYQLPTIVLCNTVMETSWVLQGEIHTSKSLHWTKPGLGRLLPSAVQQFSLHHVTGLLQKLLRTRRDLQAIQAERSHFKGSPVWTHSNHCKWYSCKPDKSWHSLTSFW